MSFIMRFIGVLILGGPITLAQTCPTGAVNTVQVSAMLDAPRDFATIYRASAIAGSALIPKLRSIAQPNSPVNSIQGAAQVALAKLGDQTSIQELKKELSANKDNRGTIEKLIRVRNDLALSILMDYFVSHKTDKSRIVDHGDYAYDPLAFLMTELRKILPSFPDVSAEDAFDQQLIMWSGWWIQHRDDSIFFPFDNGFSDPHLQCLARKVDWGFPDAILDISLYDEKTATSVFHRHLASNRVGIFKLHTMNGNIQTLLAKAGDDIELRRIEHELRQISANDAIDKLRFIGGRRAVEVLVGSLDITQEQRELSKFYSAGDSERLASDFQKILLYTLGKLVNNPPLPPNAATGSESGAKWVAWWEKEKNNAAFHDFQPDYIHE